MPESNLPPLYLHTDGSKENKYGLIDVTYLATQIPELPQETRQKLKDKYNLPMPLVLVLVVNSLITLNAVLAAIDILGLSYTSNFCNQSI